MAKDIYHDAVKEALQKDGWKITDEPLTLTISIALTYFVDLAAEKFIIATKETRFIIVEVKTFAGISDTYDFHGALGQYCVYKSALRYLKKSEQLLLAVPHKTYLTFFQEPFIQQVLKDYDCEVISYDPLKKKIIHGNI